MGKVIAIVSGKGGTGKTTTAVNLGIALTNFGREAIVVDANLSTPNVGLHIGQPMLPVTLHDVLDGRKRIADACYLHQSGLKVVPASISLKKAREADFENLKDALTEFLALPSVIILDSAAGIGREAMAAIMASDETLIVTNPDLPSVTDALKTIKIAEEVGSTVVGVVLNRVRNDGLEMTTDNVETILDLPVVGIIPEDNYVRRALHMKSPLLYEFPKSRAAIAFKKLAANMLGQSYEIKGE